MCLNAALGGGSGGFCLVFVSAKYLRLRSTSSLSAALVFKEEEEEEEEEPEAAFTWNHLSAITVFATLGCKYFFQTCTLGASSKSSLRNSSYFKVSTRCFKIENTLRDLRKVQRLSK